MANNSFKFGMIGLGTMGRNLLLNMADHGFAVVGFDKDATKGATLESSATPGTTVKGVSTMAEMIQALEKPRRMMMLVPAGKPVDDVINDLLPLLDKGDIVIDGGNSHYSDTLRRVTFMEEKGFHFMGVGISVENMVPGPAPVSCLAAIAKYMPSSSRCWKRSLRKSAVFPALPILEKVQQATM